MSLAKQTTIDRYYFGGYHDDGREDMQLPYGCLQQPDLSKSNTRKVKELEEVAMTSETDAMSGIASVDRTT